MSADPYTTRASVIRRLPIGGVPSEAGLVASAVASTNAITFDGHGLETDDPITLRAVDGGSLPAPIVEGTTYYARRLTHATFSLAATVGGSEIDLTTSGVSVVVLRAPDFDYWIGVYSRWADTSLPAHAVPMGRDAAVPAVVECIVADLVAKRMFGVGGQASESLKDMEVASLAQLARFAAGMPLRDANVTAPTTLAASSSLGAAADLRGWGTGAIP